MSAVPKVSVVLIVLDGERFLGEAIESVLAQTTADWELVIVDDGSTDGTAAIASGFAADDDRIRVVQHPGRDTRGMSASRNLGVRESRGVYVTFLDHDDVMTPVAIEEQAGLLDRHDEAAIVLGPNRRWRSWATNGAARPDEVQRLGVPGGTVLAPPGMLPVFLEDSAATPLGFMVRRPAYDDVGGCEESFGGMYEDQVLQAKLYLAHPVHVSGQVWRYYRQHDDSCVARTFQEGGQHLARRRFLRWLEAYVGRTGGADAELRGVIRAEMRRTRHARTSWLFRQARNRIARLVGR
jgi:glycosyltransferase involved in cell wall biosynthesis